MRERERERGAGVLKVYMGGFCHVVEGQVLRCLCHNHVGTSVPPSLPLLVIRNRSNEQVVKLVKKDKHSRSLQLSQKLRLSYVICEIKSKRNTSSCVLKSSSSLHCKAWKQQNRRELHAAYLKNGRLRTSTFSWKIFIYFHWKHLLMHSQLKKCVCLK